MAAAMHYVAAVGLETSSLLKPADANIMGFLAAFPVSYFGHRFYSFSHLSSKHRQAFPRFFAVALLGFLGNQFLVLSALKYTALPFWLVLGVVMVLIAISTYVLSRFWAFKGTN